MKRWRRVCRWFGLDGAIGLVGAIFLGSGLVGCAQPILSIASVTSERLQDDRVLIKVEIKNTGTAAWIGSVGDGEDRFCVRVSWFAQKPEESFAHAERCFDQQINKQQGTTLNLLSSWAIPKPTTTATKIQIRLDSFLPNPGATLQKEIDSP